MQIILLKSAKKLGKEGDVLDVKDGYARNYLIPQGIALLATSDSLKRLEKIKRIRKKTAEKSLVKAKEIKDALEDISLTISAKAKDDDEIYGSITAVQVAKAFKEEKIDIEMKMIQMEEPIKKLGAYTITVKIHPTIEANVRVWIVKK